MGLFVTAPAGEKFTLNVDASETVENVLDKIEERTGYDVDYLVHGTNMLSEEMTLEEAGLETEANIEAHCNSMVESVRERRRSTRPPRRSSISTRSAPRPSLNTTRLTSLAKSSV